MTDPVVDGIEEGLDVTEDLLADMRAHPLTDEELLIDDPYQIPLV